MNRLKLEKSLYLQQHKSDPVHWFPWGCDAFDEAKKRNCPIFLSIGYSACHWCHVMARESFRNEEIAQELNENYVAIKVDREEFPHIDRQYMLFLEAMNGSGGWPATLLLTPALEPFFGGTYFPPRDTEFSPGLLSILKSFSSKWNSSMDDIQRKAHSLCEEIDNIYLQLSQMPKKILARSLIYRALAYYDSDYDAIYGGFGNKPKFPSPSIIRFLVAAHYKGRNIENILNEIPILSSSQLAKVAFDRGIMIPSGGLKEHQQIEELRAVIKDNLIQRLLLSRKALGMAAATMTKICNSGIYDFVDGGVHRYSIDREWRLPHFEKMLYDQSQMICVLTDVYISTKNEFFLSRAISIMRYCQSQLKHAEVPLFGSGQDADSDNGTGEHEEGFYYLWTFDEINAILPDDKKECFFSEFEVSTEGNLPAEYLNESNLKRNVLRKRNLASNLESKSVQECLQHLREYRAKIKKSPVVDSKCITGWNAVMISAFVKLYIATQKLEFKESATECTEFIFRNMHNEVSSEISRGYNIQQEGSSLDYALLISAALDLYEATFEYQWIEWAERLHHRLCENFSSDDGSLFLGRKDSTDCIISLRDDFDGSELSANSVHSCNLLRMARLTADKHYEERSLKIFHSFAPQLESTPPPLPFMMTSLVKYYVPCTLIMIVGKLKESNADDLVKYLWAEHFNFFSFLIITCDESDFTGYIAERNSDLNALIKQYNPLSGKLLVQICKDLHCYSCEPSIESIQQILCKRES